jgi:hypothetical protein
MRRHGRAAALAAAKRWKPRGEPKVEISFCKDSIGLINAMLRNPFMLKGGLEKVNVEPYKAKDEVGARQTRRVVRWLEKSVLGERNEIKAWKGRIDKVYVERLKAIVKHFEDVGYMSYLVDDYLTLLDELEGKELDDDSIEETDGESETPSETGG